MADPMELVFQAMQSLQRGKDVQTMDDLASAMWMIGLKYEAVRLKEEFKLKVSFPLKKLQGAVEFAYTDRPSVQVLDGLSASEWERRAPCRQYDLRSLILDDNAFILRPTGGLRIRTEELKGHFLIVAFFNATEYLCKQKLQNARTVYLSESKPGVNAFGCRILAGKLGAYKSARKRLSSLKHEMNGCFSVTVCCHSDSDTVSKDRWNKNCALLPPDSTFWLQRRSLTWCYGVTGGTCN